MAIGIITFRAARSKSVNQQHHIYIVYNTSKHIMKAFKHLQFNLSYHLPIPNYIIIILNKFSLIPEVSTFSKIFCKLLMTFCK